MISFFGKKKDELKKLKDAVGAAVPEPPKPPAVSIEHLSAPQRRMKEEMLPPIPDLEHIELAPPPEKPRFAPLFVKIERYNIILTKIKKLRNIVSALQRIAELKKKIEKISSDTQETFERSLRQVAIDLQALDVELIRPEIKPIQPPALPPKFEEIEKYVQELQMELGSLQKELEKIQV